METYTKWVACWGNATSITDRKEAVYAKDITLRYPVRIVFSGSKLRFRFSNLTGTEPVTINKVVIMHHSGCKNYLTFGGQQVLTIEPGKEIESDALEIDITAGDEITVSMYLKDFTQMNAGTLITGPLSKGQYSYGDFAEADELPLDLTRKTNWFYFLNTIDILTEEKNRAIVCYGDSITAQSWPDYLAIRWWEEGRRDVSVIRRAVSGTRILRQYDCITYAAYGLKGATRFPIEMNVAGASDVIIQHGINDIIHPVGSDVNPFRPWSDMPTLEDLEQGMENIYVRYARGLGLKVWAGTLLPIYGWRTYNEDREKLRNQFNDWLRECSRFNVQGSRFNVQGSRFNVQGSDSSLSTLDSQLSTLDSRLSTLDSPLGSAACPKQELSTLFDGCIDFDKAVMDPEHPAAFAPGFDSGDHLHPSETAYKAMAYAVEID